MDVDYYLNKNQPLVDDYGDRADCNPVAFMSQPSSILGRGIFKRPWCNWKTRGAKDSVPEACRFDSCWAYALVAQSAEAFGLNPKQCGFDFRPAYYVRQ